MRTTWKRSRSKTLSPAAPTLLRPGSRVAIGSGPPAHLVDRPPGIGVHVAALDHESMLLVEAQRAAIVLVDVQRQAGGRQPPRFGEQCFRQPRRPGLGRHHDLIEIAALGQDGDESHQVAALFGDHDDGDGKNFVAPALAPPVEAGGKVDDLIGLLPGAPPQLDRRFFVVRRVGAQRERRLRRRGPPAFGFSGRGHGQRSVSLSSMRRLRRKASSVRSLSSGWNSPKPAATSRCGDTPLEIMYWTTEMARADDSAQLDGYCAVVIGRTSVWPSMRSTQAISFGISFSSSSSAPASLSSSARPSGRITAEPESKNTSDWNTKRSPTTRMSGRLLRIALSRPKNSER